MEESQASGEVDKDPGQFSRHIFNFLFDQLLLANHFKVSQVLEKTQLPVLSPSISFAQQGLVGCELLQDRIPCIHLALSGACHKTKARCEVVGC